MVSPSRIVTLQNFHSQRLDNSRDIYLYLPPGYEQARDTRYPVLYVHDGQNAFMNGYNGQSWNLHHLCDKLLEEQRMAPFLVVAVSNMGAERNSEFAHAGPYSELLEYPCRGEAYEQFLIEELKPFIDRQYRTRPEAEWTALLGSSRGGLVTYHIGFRRPDIFGKLALMSPYFSQHEDANMRDIGMTLQFDRKQPLQIWIDTGGMEGLTVRTGHVREVVDHLLDLGYRSGEDLIYYLDPTAAHDEEAWAERVCAPLLYFFGEIGQVSAVELTGGEVAGIEGVSSHLNPVIHYDSGFRMTDLDATFRVEPTGAVEVDSRGLIHATAAGIYSVHYSFMEHTAIRSLRIVPSLPEKVKVAVLVKVPADTPPDARIYAPFELYRKDSHTFSREVELPREAGFTFYISEHSGLLETDEAGSEPVRRSFMADHSLQLAFEVKSWVARNGL